MIDLTEEDIIDESLKYFFRVDKNTEKECIKNAKIVQALKDMNGYEFYKCLIFINNDLEFTRSFDAIKQKLLSAGEEEND